MITLENPLTEWLTGGLFFPQETKMEKGYTPYRHLSLAFMNFIQSAKNDNHEKKKEILKILDDYFFETFVPENFHASNYPWFRVLPAESSIKKVIDFQKIIKIP